jgi:DNA-binding GntR family transcriptional regulator
LRRLLTLKQIPAGSRLSETQWTKKLKVNQAALWEAFALLEAEDFIDHGPVTGYFVPKLTIDDIREVLAIRFMVESQAIELICQTRCNNRQKLKTLYEACDQFEQMIANSYVLGSTEADGRFHEHLIKVSGNKRLASISQRVPWPVIQSEIINLEAGHAATVQILAEHLAILEFVSDGVVNQAIGVLRTHLNGY